MTEETILWQMVISVAGLLFVSLLVLAFTERLRLPFTVMLVLVGMGIRMLSSLIPDLSEPVARLNLSPDLIFYIFLPTLVFESAFNMDGRLLRRNLGMVMLLAVPGFLLSTFIIGGMLALFSEVAGMKIPLTVALLLGAILSATDPVAVISLFKQLGAPQKLTILVEGESLFNDASALVVARILLGVLLAGTITTSTVYSGILDLIILFGGGILCGSFLALWVGLAMGRERSNAVSELILTIILAYASYILAEHLFHVSGIMATVGAGLTLGGWGYARISPAVRHTLDTFWEVVAFIANAMIFLLVGLRLEVSTLWDSWIFLLVIVSLLVSRYVMVYGMIPMIERFSGRKTVESIYKPILFWGGLRGAIAIAIVLSLPKMEETRFFEPLVAGAVLFTLITQGLTIRPLMHRLGLDRPPLPDRLALASVAVDAAQRTGRGIHTLLEDGFFSSAMASRLKHQNRQKLEEAESELNALRLAEINPEEQKQLLFMRCLNEARSFYSTIYHQGHLSEEAFRELVLVVDTQLDALRYSGVFIPIQAQTLRSHRLLALLTGALDHFPGCSRLAERLRRSRVARDYEEAWGECRACQHVLNALDNQALIEGMQTDILESTRKHFLHTQDLTRAALDQASAQFPEFVSAMQELLGRRLTLLARNDAAHDGAELGSLPPYLAHQIELEVDSGLKRLRGHTASALKTNPEELLRIVPFFSGITSAGFSALAARMQQRTVAAEEVLIAQHDHGDSLFLIARGVFRVTRKEADRQRTLATLQTGDFFGEMTLLQPGPRTATVVALTPGSIYRLDRRAVLEAMSEYPLIQKALEEAAALRAKEQHS